MLILKRKHKENPFEQYAQTDFWSERQDSNLRPDGPKPPALSTAPRPDVFNYISNDLFLQVVKHVVKPLFTAILRESRVPKKSVFTRAFLQCLQGLSRFCFLARSALLPAGASPPVSCSQTRRATNCATSRFVPFSATRILYPFFFDLSIDFIDRNTKALAFRQVLLCCY